MAVEVAFGSGCLWLWLWLCQAAAAAVAGCGSGLWPWLGQPGCLAVPVTVAVAYGCLAALVRCPFPPPPPPRCQLLLFSLRPPSALKNFDSHKSVISHPPRP